MEVTNLVRLTGHGGPVYGLGPGRLANTIFSCSSDGSVAAWDLTTYKPLNFTVKLNHAAYSIWHDALRALLIIGNAAGGIHVVDLAAHTEVKLLQNHTQPIFRLMLSADGKHLYAASADGCLSLTNMESLECVKVLRLTTAKVRDIAIRSDQKELAVACGDGTVQLLNAQTLERIGQLSVGPTSVNSVAYHPNGKHLLAGDKDAHLHVWSLETGLCEQSLPAHNYAIYAIAFSPSGHVFATASRDKTVKLWDPEGFEVLKRLDQKRAGGHLNSVNCLYWADDQKLLSAGDDRSIILWQVRLG